MPRKGPARGSFAALQGGRHGMVAKAREAAASKPKGEPLPADPPAWLHLSVRAADIWRANLPAIVEHATSADAATYGAWCTSQEAIQATQRKKKKTREDRDDIRAEKRVALAYARELGLTVVSRSRIPKRDEIGESDGDEATQASQLA